jgi:hypothetical protein
MPEEVKTETSTEDKVAESIVRGLRPVLEDVSRAVAASSKPAPTVQQSAPTLSRPSEDELAEAMVEGNKSKVADILRKQRAYDSAQVTREIGTLSNTGGAAISASARAVAELTIPEEAKPYKKEIREMVDQFTASNPGAVVTPEVYERATEIILGRHYKEISAQKLEEGIRRGREPQATIIPTNDRGEPIEPEPTELSQVLKAGDWKKEFREKQGARGGRSEEEELRRMGFAGFKGFLQERKQNEQMIEDTGGTSFGLDRDWVWTDKSKGEGHYIN